MTDDLSPLAAAFGATWLVLRDDTEHTPIDLFRCDRNLVESAATEWFEAHPTWVLTVRQALRGSHANNA